ncbi:hypothetical protein CJF30_00003530 [Rutstroemia sp. NJR-2017a BBW]|nr:hypothetical protein CJF30_00003530 [Rutstroemia sp. NJR-2017a BBW]
MYSSVPGPAWNPTSATSSTIVRERSSSTQATSPQPSSPTSLTSRGRLRGLSYLRSYTQNHLLSRESHSNNNNISRPTVSRATSYPSPTSSPTSSTAPHKTTIQTSPTAQRSTTTVESSAPGTNNQDNLGSTNGWLPTTASSSALLSGNGSAAVTTDLTASMARTRSAGTGGATDMPSLNRSASAGGTHHDKSGMSHQLPSIRFSAHQDPRAHRPSLVFTPMSRILPTGKEVIKVGRYSERDNQAPQTPNVPSSAPVGFKSKVVSRRHCEFWFSDGRWFIKDVKSSSGTFLNHIRLSQPGTESRPYPVNDGDIVQLGIDFKGGEEMIFRCVKIRVELNKGWQTGPSSFNVQSHKRLRELNNMKKQSGSGASGSSQDCSICLGPIAPCQSLFVAPCSHTWHYKCIRVIINGPHWPHFICPNCRSVADLEAELDDPDGEWEEYLASDAELEAEAQPEPPTKVTPANTTDVSSEDLAVSAHQQDSINATAARNPPQSDEELDVSDASSTSAQVHEDMAFLAVTDSPPLSASATPIPRVNNSTVPPLDIIPRKPVPSSASGSSSRAEQGRGSPSPNGLRPALTDPLTGEGPMTPRNDAGPFVFDGSAGRASGVRLTLGLADLNTETAVQSPATPQVTPQTAS